MEKNDPWGPGTDVQSTGTSPGREIEETSGKILVVANPGDPAGNPAVLLKKYFPRLTVLTAATGNQGLEIACREIPGVVLVDQAVTDPDGLEVCKQLKLHHNTRPIPVIILTEKKTGTRDRFTALDSGADGLLAKPLDKAELLAQVKGMIRLKKAEDRLRTDTELKKALKEKELLLREVHHRIKNNLAMVASLLNIQSSYLKDEQAQVAFAESRKRINSIALIHEKLYHSRDLANIEFGQYLRDLTAALIKSYSIPPERVEVVMDIGDIYLNMDISIPLGLIVTELLTNSLKYGFKENRKLTLTIRLKVENHHLYLVVADDGVGFPSDLNWQNTETLGIQLVNLLARQLEGQIQLERENGTLFRFIFPGPGMPGETNN
jgi:two-component sensor histidine kinase/CheY-like chemotaxis protein